VQICQFIVQKWHVSIEMTTIMMDGTACVVNVIEQDHHHDGIRIIPNYVPIEVQRHVNAYTASAPIQPGYVHYIETHWLALLLMLGPGLHITMVDIFHTPAWRISVS
jgi:hypothetical protein